MSLDEQKFENLEELFRERFKDWEAAPPTGMWSKISAEANANKGNRRKWLVLLPVITCMLLIGAFSWDRLTDNQELALKNAGNTNAEVQTAISPRNTEPDNQRLGAASGSVGQDAIAKSSPTNESGPGVNQELSMHGATSTSNAGTEQPPAATNIQGQLNQAVNQAAIATAIINQPKEGKGKVIEGSVVHTGINNRRPSSAPQSEEQSTPFPTALSVVPRRTSQHQQESNTVRSRTNRDLTNQKLAEGTIAQAASVGSTHVPAPDQAHAIKHEGGSNDGNNPTNGFSGPGKAEQPLSEAAQQPELITQANKATEQHLTNPTEEVKSVSANAKIPSVKQDSVVKEVVKSKAQDPVKLIAETRGKAENKLSLWAIDGYFMPRFTYRRVVAGENNEMQVRSLQASNAFSMDRFGYETGIRIVRAITKKAEVNTGAYFSFINEELTYKVDHSTPVAMVRRYNVDGSMELTPEFSSGTIQQKSQFYYAGLNLGSSLYLFNTNRIRLTGGAGLNWLMRGYTVRYKEGTLYQQYSFPSPTAPLEQINMNLYAGFGYIQPLTPRFSLMFEPTFNYFLFSTYKDREPITVTPTTLGINFMVRYKL